MVWGSRALIGVLLASTLAACSGGGSNGGTAANGEESKPAAQVLTDAKAAMAHTGSFHVLLTQNDQGSLTSLDLVLSRNRGGGTVTASGATLDIVVSGGLVYVKASAASWQKLLNNTSEAQLVANRWIKAPASNPNFSGLAGFGDESSFLDAIKPQGSFTKRSGTTVVNGRNAVALVDSTGSILYVAASGPPYMLRVSNTAGSSSAGSSGTFGEFGTAVVPAVPVGAISLPTG